MCLKQVKAKNEWKVFFQYHNANVVQSKLVRVEKVIWPIPDFKTE